MYRAMEMNRRMPDVGPTLVGLLMGLGIVGYLARRLTDMARDMSSVRERLARLEGKMCTIENAGVIGKPGGGSHE